MERPRSRAHLVEHAAEAEQIGAGIDGRAARLLGRQKTGRANDGAVERKAWGVFRRACQSEIE